MSEPFVVEGHLWLTDQDWHGMSCDLTPEAEYRRDTCQQLAALVSERFGKQPEPGTLWSVYLHRVRITIERLSDA